MKTATVTLPARLDPYEITAAVERTVALQKDRPWRPRVSESLPDGNGWDEGDRIGLRQVSCYTAALIWVSPPGSSEFFHRHRTYKKVVIRQTSSGRIPPCPCHQELELDSDVIFDEFVESFQTALTTITSQRPSS